LNGSISFVTVSKVECDGSFFWRKAAPHSILPPAQALTAAAENQLEASQLLVAKMPLMMAELSYSIAFSKASCCPLNLYVSVISPTT